MTDDSCKVPSEDLDDGFNPCRKQVVENGELCQYAHMYDVMNERYDREKDTSYLNSVKRDKITSTTPVLLAGNNTQIYANSTNGEGRVNMLPSSAFNNPDNHTEASIPSAKAVADYVPIPLPISKGGTGGNTPYVTDDLDALAIFVMHDAPNDRYDAAPMSALTGYLDGRYYTYTPKPLNNNDDLNNLNTPGCWIANYDSTARTIVNRPDDVEHSFVVWTISYSGTNEYIAQYIMYSPTGNIKVRVHDANGWSAWNDFPTSVHTPIPIDQGGTGAQTAAAALTSLGVPQEISNAFAVHTATTVADNDLLPTNALMIDYVAAHSLNTPPSPFSYQVAPYPSGTWEGEMTVNVVPVFSVTIGAVEYIIARLYGAKKFNYNGTADNISLFSSIQIVEEYPYIFKDGTSIPLKLSIQGRSYTAGTYGFNPRESGPDVLLNNQTVSSVLSSANLNMSNSLNCVFGTGTNTPGVTVSFSCLTLMWRNLS